MRILLLKLALLLLPFALYGLYLALSHVRGQEPKIRVPHLALLGAGVGILAVFVFAIGPMSGGDPNERYVPARVEDGKRIPGGFVPADDADTDGDGETPAEDP